VFEGLGLKIKLFKVVGTSSRPQEFQEIAKYQVSKGAALAIQLASEATSLYPWLIMILKFRLRF